MRSKKKGPIAKPVRRVTVGQRVVNTGVAALAREVGLSEATISVQLKNGKTPAEIRAAAARRQGRAPAKPTKAAAGKPAKTEYDMVLETRARYDALEDAKLRRAQALAERQEIENMLRRGELIPVAYARLWGTRFLIAGRDELMKGPSELADSLADEDDPLQVAALLRTWVERAMAKFEGLRMLWEGNLEAEEVA